MLKYECYLTFMKKTNYAVSHLISLMTMPCEYLVNAETMTCAFGEKQKENVGSSAIEFSHLKRQNVSSK